MRRMGLFLVFVLASTVACADGLRAPSCDALVAFAMGARADPVEVSFGKPAAIMTLADFDRALDIVTICIGEVEDRESDVPGLLTRERKRPQLVGLTLLMEDLKLYRSQRRELERRAARRTD